jgi:purine-nucleoside phosphorylase
MLNEIKKAQQYICSITNFTPEFGIVLGTGLGDLVKSIDVVCSISYQDIPNFPISTVESHAGKLIFGFLGGKKVVVMQGRFHYYEGYDMNQIVFPIRVLHFLGVKKLLISNAAGGINPKYQKGDLVLVKDHINLFPGNPLIGKNYPELGPRFVDMYQPYDKTWIELAKNIAQLKKISIHLGVYAGLTGPMLETPAEYKYLSIIGADLVGMSTIPEVIAANHLGMKCLVCSIVTDECYGEIQPVNITEIIEVANNAQPKLCTLFEQFIQVN